MSETPEVPEIDAGEFDLGEWIAGNRTYPEYIVKVHLNKQAVITANKMSEEIEKLREEQKVLEDLMERGQTASTSLTEPSEAAKQHSENVKKIKAKCKEREEVLAKAKDSALTIVLRKPDDDFTGSAYDKVRSLINKDFPEHSEVLNGRDQEKLSQLYSTNPEVLQRQSVYLVHYMAASVTNAKGQTIERGPKLDIKAIEKLVKSLEQSDFSRVQNNINLAMVGAELREEKIDAGFLG